MGVAFLMGETFFVSYLDTCVRDGSDAYVCCEHCLPESTLCLRCDLHINSPTNSSGKTPLGRRAGVRPTEGSHMALKRSSRENCWVGWGACLCGIRFDLLTGPLNGFKVGDPKRCSPRSLGEPQKRQTGQRRRGCWDSRGVGNPGFDVVIFSRTP